MSPFRGMTRRDLLKHAALALPALAVLPRLSYAADLPAYTSDPPPPGPSQKPQKVIVVGVGLAGLAAAWELAEGGHEVTVLEAQLRAGGRVYTLREPFADGLFADVGTISFSDSFKHFVRYVKAFNLSTAPLGRPSLAVNYHLRGKRFELKPGETPDWPYDLAPEEKGLPAGRLIQRYFTAVEKLGIPTEPGWRPDAFKSWDDITLAQFMKNQGASSEAVDLLGRIVFWGHGWAQGSALHRLVSDVGLFYLGQKAQVVQGGSGRMTDAFARALRERIWYGAPVVRIVQDSAKVRAVVRQAGGEQTLEADRLICTVPAPVLRRIELSPELPARKRQILEKLRYTPATRIFLQSRRRFWADAGRAGTAWTDLPIAQVAEHPFVRPADLQTPRGILEGHAKGPEAERLDGLDAEARLAFALENLEKVHPGLRSQFEGGTSYSWGADPWALGAYPEWEPGQLTQWMPELARPEGRVHFAGEHTSWLSRTTEGALESGNRAAREVIEAGQLPSPP